MNISIIVPVYNVEKYLEKCLESILRQSYQEYEVIIVDDGSTDGSSVIVEKYSEKYADKICCIYQKNQGLSAARNTGLRKAKGKYILFVDSDDAIAPDMLEKLYHAAVKYDSDLVMCAFRSVDETGKEIKAVREQRMQNEIPYQLKEKKEILLCQNAAWNKLYRKDVIQKYNLEFTENVWYEDIRFTKKYMLYAQNIVYCDEVLYNYLIRQGSIMNSAGSERNAEIVDAFCELAAYFKAQGVYEQFKYEVEFLAIEHIYIAALVRMVLSHNYTLLKYIRENFIKMFPDYKRNPYISSLDRNRKMIFFLLKYKLYFFIDFLFCLKEKRG